VGPLFYLRARSHSENLREQHANALGHRDMLSKFPGIEVFAMLNYEKFTSRAGNRKIFGEVT
jgi:hypothetical protein